MDFCNAPNLDNTPNQPTNIRTKNWVQINGDSGGRYNTNSEIEFKTSVLKPSLCDYNDAYIDIDVVMPIYNLTEYSDNYSKTFSSAMKRLKSVIVLLLN